MPAKLVHVALEQPELVARHIARLTQGQDVTVVAARRTPTELREEVKAQGGNLTRLHVVEVVPRVLNWGDPSSSVSAAHQLGADAERAWHSGPATLVVDDAESLSLALDDLALDDFARFASLHMMGPGQDHEYIIGMDGERRVRALAVLRKVIQEEGILRFDGGLGEMPRAQIFTRPFGADEGVWSAT